jgi:hypothetical protein
LGEFGWVGWFAEQPLIHRGDQDGVVPQPVPEILVHVQICCAVAWQGKYASAQSLFYQVSASFCKTEFVFKGFREGKYTRTWHALHCLTLSVTPASDMSAFWQNNNDNC